jgi:hypothetical protein
MSETFRVTIDQNVADGWAKTYDGTYAKTGPHEYSKSGVMKIGKSTANDPYILYVRSDPNDSCVAFVTLRSEASGYIGKWVHDNTTVSGFKATLQQAAAGTQQAADTPMQ